MYLDKLVESELDDELETVDREDLFNSDIGNYLVFLKVYVLN